MMKNNRIFKTVMAAVVFSLAALVTAQASEVSGFSFSFDGCEAGQLSELIENLQTTTGADVPDFRPVAIPSGNVAKRTPSMTCELDEKISGFKKVTVVHNASNFTDSYLHFHLNSRIVSTRIYTYPVIDWDKRIVLRYKHWIIGSKEFAHVGSFSLDRKNRFTVSVTIISGFNLGSSLRIEGEGNCFFD